MRNFKIQSFSGQENAVFVSFDEEIHSFSSEREDFDFDHGRDRNLTGEQKDQNRSEIMGARRERAFRVRKKVNFKK